MRQTVASPDMSTNSTSEIEAVASDWLIRKDSGNWSEGDQARFDEWLQQSTLHRVAYLRLDLAWEEARRLKALGAGVQGNAPPPPGHWNVGLFFRQREGGTAKRITLIRAAAVVMGVAFVSAAAVYLHTSGLLSGDRYSTSVGGMASVPISDGSKITLNTDSQIRVVLTETERRVELKQGEAFFEVAKDPKRPFVVSAGHKRIIAVGTAFSVRRDAHDEIQVVVTEGTVRFENLASSPSPASVPELLVHAGGIARSDAAGTLVQAEAIPETQEKLSWRTGVLAFRDQTLATAVAEFNRYNERKIVIEAPEIGELRIEGNFRADNLDAFVRLVEQAYPVTVERQSDRRIVLHAR